MRSSASSTPGSWLIEHGVEHFVAELRQAGGDADGFLEQNFGGAIGGKRLGQPAARAMQRGDVQHLHPRRHLAPDFGREALRGEAAAGLVAGMAWRKCGAKIRGGADFSDAVRKRSTSRR